MADNQLTIDTATLFADADARTIEFSGEIDGEVRLFAVQYDAIEALDGATPDDAPIAALERHRDAIERAGAAALARDGDGDRITISENDLD